MHFTGLQQPPDRLSWHTTCVVNTVRPYVATCWYHWSLDLRMRRISSYYYGLLMNKIRQKETAFRTIKGTLRRRLTYIFSRSIKSLIYHIFTYKVWTLNFYRKGPEIWSFILTLKIPNSAGRSYRPLGGDFVYLHCQLWRRICWLCSVH